MSSKSEKGERWNTLRDWRTVAHEAQHIWLTDSCPQGPTYQTDGQLPTKRLTDKCLTHKAQHIRLMDRCPQSPTKPNISYWRTAAQHIRLTAAHSTESLSIQEVKYTRSYNGFCSIDFSLLQVQQSWLGQCREGRYVACVLLHRFHTFISQGSRGQFNTTAHDSIYYL